MVFKRTPSAAVVTLGFLYSAYWLSTQKLPYTVDNPARGLLDRKIPKKHNTPGTRYNNDPT